MQHLPRLVVFSVAVFFSFTGNSFCQSESDAANKQGEQSIVGSWQANSITILSDSGQKETYPGLFDNRQFSVVISENEIKIWEGTRKFAEMSYKADTLTTPPTIKAKYHGQDMLGIYLLKDDHVKIGLLDARKGQPTNYNKADYDIVLALRRFQGQPIMVVNVEKGKESPLVLLPDYTSCGSPNWSRDGSKIAFDAWRSLIGENYFNSHVFVVNADGSDMKDLGDGATPSFSPDGKRIAYNRYNPNNGVWIMNADGSDKKRIASEGFCVRWSPKGDELLYGTQDNANLCIHDLKSQENRILLKKKYRQVFWGFCWSPDAKWICFKGDLQNGESQVAMVDPKGEAEGFKVLLPSSEIPGAGNTDSCFSWSPDGKKILVSATLQGDIDQQLYILNLDGKTPLERLPGQNPATKNYFSCWSPDGEKVVLAFWPGNNPSNNDGSFLRRIFGF
jgi:TolB protein